MDFSTRLAEALADPANDQARIRWVKGRHDRRGVLVSIRDVALFDADFRRDGDYYVGRGGESASGVEGRYGRAERFLRQAAASGSGVDAPSVTTGGMEYIRRQLRAYRDEGLEFPGPTISFNDGRHRYAVARDHGWNVAVVVSRGEAKYFLERYGGEVLK